MSQAKNLEKLVIKLGVAFVKNTTPTTEDKLNESAKEIVLIQDLAKELCNNSEAELPLFKAFNNEDLLKSLQAAAQADGFLVEDKKDKTVFRSPKTPKELIEAFTACNDSRRANELWRNALEESYDRAAQTAKPSKIVCNPLPLSQ